MTDTCENNVSKFVGGLLNQLYHLADKSVSVKPLSQICFTSNLSTIYQGPRRGRG